MGWFVLKLNNMKKYRRQLLTVIFISILISFLSFGSQVKGLELNWPTAPGGKELSDESTLVDFVDYAYRWGIFLGGLAAFIALIIAGFQYLTSVGDPAKMKEARERIIAAIAGLVLLLSTFIILNTLNPDLTTLSPPTSDISGMPTGNWQNPDWDKPCEFVKIYKEKNYKGHILTIGKGGKFDLEECILTGIGIPIIPGVWTWYISETPIKSVLMKGACQLNLYEEDKCKGNFTGIGKSMPNLDWVSQSHIYSIKAVDISPPIPPKVKTVTFPPPTPLKQPDGTYKATLKGALLDFGRTDRVRVHFEYGKNKLYLDKTAPPDPEQFQEIFVQDIPAGGIPFSVEIEGLATNTTYFWRAIAANEAGPAYGTTSSFTTGP